jgi:hypothetical protein
MRPGAFEFSDKWVERIRNLGETGMGYVVASVTLKDGRVFPQVAIDTGCVTMVQGLPDIPFSEDDIAEIKATHEKWDFSKNP